MLSPLFVIAIIQTYDLILLVSQWILTIMGFKYDTPSYLLYKKYNKLLSFHQTLNLDLCDLDIWHQFKCLHHDIPNLIRINISAKKYENMTMTYFIAHTTYKLPTVDTWYLSETVTFYIVMGLVHKKTYRYSQTLNISIK